MWSKIVTGFVTSVLTGIVLQQMRKPNRKLSIVEQRLNGQELIVKLSNGDVVLVDTASQNANMA